MAPYLRTVVTRVDEGPGGTSSHVARLDDHFHGFEVTLDVRGGVVIAAAATSHRAPWSTCPGALDSVARLRGPLPQVTRDLVREPRRNTCVHVNDLVWLATQGHASRRYDVEVTPTGASLHRDGEPLFGWRLDSYQIASPGPFQGLGVQDLAWAERLRAVGADDDLREAVRVLRRALLVAIGYFELPWAEVATAADSHAGTMVNSCHTFSDGTVELARRTAVPPDTGLYR